MKLYLHSLIVIFLFTASIFPQSGIDYITVPLSIRYKESPDSLRQAEEIYRNILDNCSKITAEENGDYKKHKALFKFFHKNLLKKYDLDSDLPSLLFRKKFDCLTAVSLYAAVCEDLKLNCKIKETTTHVYIKFTDDGEDKIIELTDPADGFDYLRNPEEYINYLIEYKLITQEEFDEKGVDGIYYDYTNSSKDAGKDQILAWILYEMAMESYFADSYALSYAYINKAIAFSKEEDIINGYAYSLSGYCENLLEKRSNIDSLLIAALLLPVENKTLEGSILGCFESYMKMLIKSGQFNNSSIDSLYSLINKRKWLTEEFPGKFKELYAQYQAVYIEHLTLSGNLKEAVQVSRKSFDYMKDHYLLQSSATRALLVYMEYLYKKDEKEQLAQLLDSCITYFKGNKLIEGAYIGIKMIEFQRLFETDEAKAEAEMRQLIQNFPENEEAKKGEAVIYHSKAMAKIRKRKYKDAMKIIQEGLTKFPDNKELKSDFDMTKDLVKNNNN